MLKLKLMMDNWKDEGYKFDYKYNKLLSYLYIGLLILKIGMKTIKMNKKYIFNDNLNEKYDKNIKIKN